MTLPPPRPGPCPAPLPDPRDCVALLPPSPATPPGAGGDPLGRLYEEFLRAPYPPGFRGVDVGGVELILVDADVAGLVLRELKGGLDEDGAALLWKLIADLDRAVPLMGDAYCAACFARLRALAAVAGLRHVPAAG